MTALIRMTAGLTHWAAAFCILYALHGLGCAQGWAGVGAGPIGLHRLVLGLAWIGGIVGGGALALWLHRSARNVLLDRVGDLLGWVGLAAIVVTGLPIVTLPACV